MGGEKDLQNCPVRNPGRVECDLNRLGMAGSAGPDLLVAGISCGAARITGLYAIDSVHLKENRFKAPETAAGKSRGLVNGIPIHSSLCGTNFSARPFRQ